MMASLKFGRAMRVYHGDNFDDIANYVLFAQEMQKEDAPVAPPRKQLVYLAGPYSPCDVDGVEVATPEWIAFAREYAAVLWDKGYAVICPHANTANFERLCMNTHYQDFMEGDFRMIDGVDAVVFLPHWEKSKGAQLELNYAMEHNIPCYPFDDFIRAGFVHE